MFTGENALCYMTVFLLCTLRKNRLFVEKLIISALCLLVMLVNISIG